MDKRPHFRKYDVDFVTIASSFNYEKKKSSEMLIYTADVNPRLFSD